MPKSNNVRSWAPYGILLKMLSDDTHIMFPSETLPNNCGNTPVTSLLKKCYLMTPISFSHQKQCQTTVGTHPYHKPPEKMLSNDAHIIFYVTWPKYSQTCVGNHPHLPKKASLCKICLRARSVMFPTPWKPVSQVISNMGSFTLWISLSPLYFQQSRGSSMLCTLPVAEFGNFITHPFYQVEHGFRSCSMAILNVFVRSWGCMSLFSGHWFMTFTRWDIVTPKISHWRSSLLSSCTCVLLVLLFDMLERDFKDQMKQFPSE